MDTSQLTSDPILPDLSPSPTQEQSRLATTLHIEVALKEHATCRFDAVQSWVESHLRDNYSCLAIGSKIAETEEQPPLITQNVSAMYVVEVDGETVSEIIRLESVSLDIHVYQLRDHEISFTHGDQDNEDEQLSAALVTELPARSLDGLWDSLIFEDNVKASLLKYVSAIMLFSERRVDQNLVTLHKLVLLHGPPGTGKTSLCRCAAIMSHRFSHGKLVEVNAASLFSRFFSESSKLVLYLFERIHEMTEDESHFVCVLIDEVESLTIARKTTVGTEPSDAMRVVNVLLTQLDRLRSRCNVLILTTSNLLEISDPAFLDRADVIRHIGPPGGDATYQILRTCLLELKRAGIIDADDQVKTLNEAALEALSHKYTPSAILYNLSRICAHVSTKGAQYVELDGRNVRSGRALRRLPLLAYAECKPLPRGACTMLQMVEAMIEIVSPSGSSIVPEELKRRHETKKVHS